MRRRPRAMVAKPKFLPIGGFATKMLVKLKYVQNFSLDPGVGGIAVHKFRANGLYDPDFTGTGHQPSNFDRLALIYDRYTVLGAKITVYPVWTSNTNLTPPMTVVLHISQAGDDLETAHASGGVSNVLEQPRLSRTIGNVGAFNATNTPRLKKLYSSSKFFGVKVTPVEPYSANVTSDPGEAAYIEVAGMSPDDIVNPAAQTFRIEIESISLFTEPKLSDAS
jgi:hypothetical protein